MTKWIKHEWNDVKSAWHRNDKTSGKVLKDNMKNCRTRRDGMEADIFS
jgi:hypothetical protein